MPIAHNKCIKYILQCTEFDSCTKMGTATWSFLTVSLWVDSGIEASRGRLSVKNKIWFKLKDTETKLVPPCTCSVSPKWLPLRTLWLLLLRTKQMSIICSHVNYTWISVTNLSIVTCWFIHTIVSIFSFIVFLFFTCSHTISIQCIFWVLVKELHCIINQYGLVTCTLHKLQHHLYILSQCIK